jgi:hypothetical protein
MFHATPFLSRLYKFVQLPCLFHALTGYYCPGCGGRRALLALLRGQLLTSILYHPLPIYVLVGLLCLLIQRFIKKRWSFPSLSRFLWGALGLLLLQTLIKNLLLVWGVSVV